MAFFRKSLVVYPALILVLAAVFTFLGVYDTSSMPFLARFALWAAVMTAGTIVTALVEPFVFRRLMRDAHPLLQLVVISSIITVPLAIGLAWFNTRFEYAWSLMNWALQFVSVFVIAFIVVVGRYMTPQVLTAFKRQANTQETTGSAAERYLERLPIRYRGAQLLAVSSEGHYLRVHTDRGEELILMRLSDAVRELEGAEGLQVHRSWWVAVDGVEETLRSNGRRSLRLKSGKVAPVSRSFQPALKQAGLVR